MRQHVTAASHAATVILGSARTPARDQPPPPSAITSRRIIGGRPAGQQICSLSCLRRPPFGRTPARAAATHQEQPGPRVTTAT